MEEQTQQPEAHSSWPEAHASEVELPGGPRGTVIEREPASRLEVRGAHSSYSPEAIWTVSRNQKGCQRDDVDLEFKPS